MDNGGYMFEVVLTDTDGTKEFEWTLTLEGARAQAMAMMKANGTWKMVQIIEPDSQGLRRMLYGNGGRAKNYGDEYRPVYRY